MKKHDFADFVTFCRLLGGWLEISFVVKFPEVDLHGLVTCLQGRNANHPRRSLAGRSGTLPYQLHFVMENVAWLIKSLYLFEMVLIMRSAKHRLDHYKLLVLF